MGQTEVTQFLKDNYPKKFSRKEIAEALNVKSVRRCINIVDKSGTLTHGKRMKLGAEVELFGAKRKKWEE